MMQYIRFIFTIFVLFVVYVAFGFKESWYINSTDNMIAMIWSLACLWSLSLLIMNDFKIRFCVSCLLIYFLLGDTYMTAKYNLPPNQLSSYVLFWRPMTSILLSIALGALIHVGNKALGVRAGL